MSQQIKGAKPSKSKSRPAREQRLIELIEVYVRMRGNLLEMASTSAEREDDLEFEAAIATSQAALEASEAAVVPLLEGRLPVIWNSYLYAVDGRTLRVREVQVLS